MTKHTCKIQRGFNLIELMVSLVIVSIATLGAWSLFRSQHSSSEARKGEAEMQMTAGSLDIFITDVVRKAGWGALSKMAFYVVDGGQNGPDEFYGSAVHNFLDGSELRATDAAEGILGFTDIISGNGSSNITLAETDLDIDQDTKVDFRGAWGQYIITDTTTVGQKVAVIKTADAGTGTLSLDSAVSGKYVAPAMALRFNSNGELGYGDINASGVQGLSELVVDFQVAYRDVDNNTYCYNPGDTCPMSPFDPDRISMIMISYTLKSRIKDDADGVVPSFTMPAAFNRQAGVASGPYYYKRYEFEIQPKNSKMAFNTAQWVM